MFERIDEVIFQVTRGNVLITVILFIICINIASAIVVFADKSFAKKEQSRISEKTLFTLAFFGGAIAEFITMQCIRHKTLHKRFMLGLPAIFVTQICLFIWWIIEWF